jgi:hypothetical protein
MCFPGALIFPMHLPRAPTLLDTNIPNISLRPDFCKIQNQNGSHIPVANIIWFIIGNKESENAVKGQICGNATSLFFNILPLLNI